VNSADEVRSLVAAMEAHGAPPRTRLWAMVETPEAVLGVGEIAAASPRLAVLVMGTNDLVKELGARHVAGREPLLTSLSLALLAARRSGVAILDGVYNDVKDLEGFGAECRQGRDLGFDGKTLIHPGQVDPCNAVFAPSADEVEEAREMLAAWDAGNGAGVVTHRGRMVENLHVEIARKVIATDEAIRNRG
jgi:citrate lyase subunit beta/citryl-CoA lyase